MNVPRAAYGRLFSFEGYGQAFFYKLFSSVSFLKKKFLEECSGCGAQFHENGPPGSPGYVPDLSNRRDKILGKAADEDQCSSLNGRSFLRRKMSQFELKRIETRLKITSLSDHPKLSILPEQFLRPPHEERRKKSGMIICQRCHNLLNKRDSSRENERNSLSVITPLTKSISMVNPNVWWNRFLETYNPQRSVFCLLVDSTDFPTSWMTFQEQDHPSGKLLSHLRSLKDIPVIIILTKIDLLPLSITRDEKELSKFRNHVRSWANAELLHRPVFDVVAVSAKSGFNLSALLDVLTKVSSFLMRGRAPSAKASLYLVGPTNSGKSRLWAKIINTKRLLGNDDDTSGQKISISTLSPGTTVGFFSASLEYAYDVTSKPIHNDTLLLRNCKKGVLIDTPGVFPFGWIPRFLTLSSLEKLFSDDTPFKANRYLVSKGQSIWIGPFVRIDLYSDIHGEEEQEKRHMHFTNIVIFATKKLPIHISKSVEEAEEEYRKLVTEASSPLTHKQMNSAELPELKEALGKVEVPKGPTKIPGIEVVLSGIGWVAISHPLSSTDNVVFVRILTPEGIGAYLRPKPLFLNSIKESIHEKANQQKRILFKTVNCLPNKGTGFHHKP